jgi:hypothetical protein
MGEREASFGWLGGEAVSAGASFLDVSRSIGAGPLRRSPGAAGGTLTVAVLNVLALTVGASVAALRLPACLSVDET